MVKRIKILCFLFVLGCGVSAQNLISYVTVNHDEAYIGQPIQMTVSVYTSTWFTSGVDVGNIQIEGALTVYFRSLSNRKTISGKDYAGVDFIYNVFPTQEGTLTIQPLSIDVESPAPGGYKGIKHTIHTKPKTITVKPVPLGYNPNNWLVSGNLTINEHWSTDTKNVKVGDVLQRTITRSAAGTTGEFIPAVIWDSIPGVSIYPKRPGVNTNKTKTSISSSRTDAANYLFEKEGEVVLPRIEFVFWNYNNRQFYKKVIDSLRIEVAPNPDLKMLAGIKKQLEAENSAIPEEDKPFLIFGLTIKRFIELLLLGLLTLYVLYKLLPWGIKKIKHHKAMYRASEGYAFKQLERVLVQSDSFKILYALKVWLIKLNPEIPNMGTFISVYGSDVLKNNFLALEQQALGKGSATFNSNTFKSELKQARARYLKKEHLNSTTSKSEWLNPISDTRKY
ncbi:BatD family protein [Formosa sp. S-31]|uniref:BatD family protein n=1 Tax=Formosa sp. S-31 TaxID=2790949 RepID=UPI003EBC3B16